ncbi:DUF6959 family protein [Streptomyces virginiae]|uniref:DUF6959 family protein n=1 Tax=Streptomyces virginiae TaxID=1961 RepID=UPI00224FC097|nr:hypothetical protein [Streptomyces virginiae]MCX5179337.1 hypothetical protein [Streptomyces virginiae]
MERVAAELFTDGGNDAVVRLPGRSKAALAALVDGRALLVSGAASVHTVAGALCFLDT